MKRLASLLFVEKKPRAMATRLLVTIVVLTTVMLVTLETVRPARAVFAGAVFDEPDTSNVTISGSTVTATVSPGSLDSVTAAEFFLDIIGECGAGTPMSLSGESGEVTATGTLPTLALGSTHTVFVHGGIFFTGEFPYWQWGPFASATFTVESTRVAMRLGAAEIARLDFGSRYHINFLPQDPCIPTDPCRVRSRFGAWNAAETLGYRRATVSVPEGTILLYERVAYPPNPCTPPNPVHPIDPCRPPNPNTPVSPCNARSFLVGFLANNRMMYDAETACLTTSYLVK